MGYKLKPLEDGIEAFQNDNFSEAYTLLMPLAKAGYAKAQCYIASLYQGGFGVPVNGAKAIEWYRKAAEQYEKDERVSATAYILELSIARVCQVFQRILGELRNAGVRRWNWVLR